jgi:hypothetical protein
MLPIRHFATAGNNLTTPKSLFIECWGISIHTYHIASLAHSILCFSIHDLRPFQQDCGYRLRAQKLGCKSIYRWCGSVSKHVFLPYVASTSSQSIRAFGYYSCEGVENAAIRHSLKCGPSFEGPQSKVQVLKIMIDCGSRFQDSARKLSWQLNKPKKERCSMLRKM